MADIARELLILGVLRRAAMSAYDVNRAVHGHAPLYRGLKRGNVYYALERLSAGGLLERDAAKTERGPSATKSVYRLTPAGDERFHALLRGALLDVQSDDTTLEVALVLLGQLPRGEAVAIFRSRADALADWQRRMRRLLGDDGSRDGSAGIAFGHSYHRARAEMQFVDDTLARLADAGWTPDWTLDDGPIEHPNRKI